MNQGVGEVAGLSARRAAVMLVDGVLRRKIVLDALMDGSDMPEAPRDRALAHMIAATTLRRHGALSRMLDSLLDKPLKGRAVGVRTILLTGLAQVVFMAVKPHAVVDLAVRVAEAAPELRAYKGLVNGVLRNAMRRRDELVALTDDPVIDLPDWLARRWVATYGDARARKIVESLVQEPALDISVKSDVAGWADRLGGIHLSTGTVRLVDAGSVSALEGYESGEWWVQDAASRLPVLLFGAVSGRTVVDLCAAPGGKTAQLASAGANVIAVDRSEKRMTRLAANMARLGLSVTTEVADAASWCPATEAEAILLDAPCSATGTIRRHPDLVHLKTEADIASLAAVQSRLLDRAVTLLAPGARLVYSTCSLEPEEGEHQIARILAENSNLHRVPVTPNEVPGFETAITVDGDLRVTPELLDPPAAETDRRFAGSAGFFVARLDRSA